MTELKTYVDFEEEDEEYSPVSIWEIKEEAIKWVKKIRSQQPPIELIKGDKEAAAFSEGVQKGIAAWIMKFFNITEAELNEPEAPK